jgi:hypothetical protein
MTTCEEGKPRVVLQVARVVANLALWWLLDAVLFVTAMSALVAILMAFSAGAIWAPLGVVAAGGTAFTLFGLLLRHWSHSGIWLTVLTATAANLGVILVLRLR